jgi:adenylate kinase
MIIVISGTPGTGKTSIAKQVSESLQFTYIDINHVIQKHKLKDGYDEKRQCDIIDENKLVQALTEIIKQDKNLVIDGHLGHELPKELVDVLIITKCNLKELEKRLTERSYSKEKIRENLDAEIFDVCLTEATGNEHTVIVVDTDQDVDLEKLKEKIQKFN